MHNIDTYGKDVGQQRLQNNLPLDHTAPETKDFVEQKTKRRDELRNKLDEVLTEVHQSSLFLLSKKNNLEIAQIVKDLDKTYIFAQVHCGRSAMKTFYEEKFQGYPAQRPSVNLMTSVFTAIENSHEGLCLTDKKTLNLLKPCISQLKQTVDELDVLKDLKGDSLREKVAQFGADLGVKLDALQTGEEHTIPVGPPGCGMFLRLVRSNNSNFNLFLYNGGLDPKKQQGVTPSTLPLFVFEGVPASKLYYSRPNGKLSSPFLTELTAITVRDVSKVDSQKVLDYFLPFKEYSVSPDKFMGNYIRCMRANFSSHKSLKGLLLHLCGTDRRAYKRLNMDVRLLTLVAEYNRHGNHLDKPELVKERAQLRIAVDNLLKTVYKYALQEQDNQPILRLEEAKQLLGTALEVLEGVKKADESARKVQEANTKAAVIEENRKDNRSQAIEAANKFSHPKMSNNRSLLVSKYKPYPHPSKSPADLKKGLLELQSFLKVFEKEIPIYWGHTDEFSAHKSSLEADGLAAVERFLAHLPPPADLFWDKVPKDQMNACFEMLSQIQLRYSRAIVHSQSKRPCSSVQQLTLFNFYAAIHRMAVKLDSEGGSPALLSHFSVDVSRFKEALDLDHMNVIDSSNQLKRRKEIERYFSECNRVAEHRDLFNWKKFNLDPSDADKILYERLLQDQGIQKYMSDGKCKECIETWVGNNANEDDRKRIQLRLLNLDLGGVDWQGLRETKEFKYEPREIQSYPVFSVKYKVLNQSGFWDYHSTQLDSLLDRKYAHIALLKQCSIAASVLLDVNASDTPKPSPKDFLGEPLKKPKNEIYNKYSDVASELMLERVEVTTSNDKNEFGLQFYGRQLQSVETKTKGVGDLSKRQFTSTQLTDAFKNAVNSSIETGIYDIYPHSHEQRQNELLSKMGSLPAGDSKLSLLQIAEQAASGETRSHNLLQWMRLNFQELEDPAMRSRFNDSPFRPQYDGNSSDAALSVSLLDLLENDPDHLLVQMRKLVDRGIGRFYRAQPYKRPKVEPLTFLLELARVIDRNYLEIYKKKIDPPLYKAELFEDLLNLNEGAAEFSPRTHRLEYLPIFALLSKCIPGRNNG